MSEGVLTYRLLCNRPIKPVTDNSWTNWDEHLDFMSGGLPFDPASLHIDLNLYKPGELNSLRSDSWLVWKTESLNKAMWQLASGTEKFKTQVALELDMLQDDFNFSRIPQRQGARKFIEYGVGGDKEGLHDIQFSLHMPPRVRGERVQPMANIIDDSVSLPRGHIFEVDAQVSSYRKLSTDAKRCYDGPSVYSWQVLNCLLFALCFTCWKRNVFHE
jgi:hypothetical protein